MAKRGAETFASHESVPDGALPFFIPTGKRQRLRVGRAQPRSPSPSDQFTTAFSSSDEMSDVDQNGAVVCEHHLANAASGSAHGWPGAAPTPSCMPQPDEQHLSALGLLTPPACPETRQFLEQLACTMRDGQLASCSNACYPSTSVPSLGTALWHAFAELNTLLARHFSELPTSMLRGYHSFVKAPREALWARFAASQGAQGQEATFGTSGGPCHVVLLRFLLEHALGCYPHASAVVYTIEVPPWLRGWCARWGHPGHGPMRVLALFAYGPAAGSGSMGGGGASAPRVLYIPCAGQ